MSLIAMVFMLASCSSGVSGGSGGDASSTGTSDISITIGSNGATASVVKEENTFYANVKEFLSLLSPAEAEAVYELPDCHEGNATIPWRIDLISFHINGVSVLDVTIGEDDEESNHCSSITRTFTVQNGDNLFAAFATQDGVNLFTGSTKKTITGDDSVEIEMHDVYTPVSGSLMDNGCENGEDDLLWSFDWPDVPGATYYELEIEDDDEYEWNSDSDLYESNYEYGIDEYEEEYIEKYRLNNWRWRVRAQVNYEWRDWSDWRTFDVEHQCLDDNCDLYVDVDNPNAYDRDGNNCRNSESPCESITYALTERLPGSETICVDAGTYDREIEGAFQESSPLVLPPGTSLLCRGDDHSTIIDNAVYLVDIRTREVELPVDNYRIFSGQQAIEGSQDSFVTGCRIINSEKGIDDNGGAMVIENNIIDANNLSACEGIKVTSSQTEVKNNIIQNIASGDCDPAGIYIYYASPSVTGNTITENTRGIFLDGGSSPAITGNNIYCNAESDLYSYSYLPVNAQNNAWDRNPPLMLNECMENGDDICDNNKEINTDGSTQVPYPCLGCASPISPAEGAVMDNGCRLNIEEWDPLIWEFDWADCEGATEYDLYVGNRLSDDEPIEIQGIETSSYNYNAGYGGFISNYNNWFYRVRAKVNGVWGDWSDERKFTVELQETDCIDIDG